MFVDVIQTWGLILKANCRRYVTAGLNMFVPAYECSVKHKIPFLKQSGLVFSYSASPKH